MRVSECIKYQKEHDVRLKGYPDDKRKPLFSVRLSEIDEGQRIKHGISPGRAINGGRIRVVEDGYPD